MKELSSHRDKLQRNVAYAPKLSLFLPQLLF